MTNPFLPSNAPTIEPTTVYQNAFTHWRRTELVSDDYSAYRYEYVFRKAGDKSNVQRTLTVDENGYIVNDALNWPAGDYRWTLYYVRQSDNRRTFIQTGRLKVMPDASTGVEFRPHAEVMLDKIESLLEGRADSDVHSYTIGNRQITKMSIKELQGWRDFYRAEVATIRAGESGRMGGNVLRVRFT
jgi:hypothetical protein